MNISKKDINALNAETSIPIACMPSSLDCTNVVPLPQNGSSKMSPA